MWVEDNPVLVAAEIGDTAHDEAGGEWTERQLNQWKTKYQEMTVPELKSEAKKQGLVVTGIKAVLVERLLEGIEEAIPAEAMLKEEGRVSDEGKVMEEEGDNEEEEEEGTDSSEEENEEGWELDIIEEVVVKKADEREDRMLESAPSSSDDDNDEEEEEESEPGLEVTSKSIRSSRSKRAVRTTRSKRCVVDSSEKDSEEDDDDEEDSEEEEEEEEAKEAKKSGKAAGKSQTQGKRKVVAASASKNEEPLLPLVGELTDDKAKEILEAVFGYDDFREGQLWAIRRGR